MKLNKWKSTSILLFSSLLASAQLSDLARIDYTILPKVNSNSQYSRIRALFNYPVKLKKEGAYFILGLDYTNINLFLEESPFLNENEINEFQILDLNIGYTFRMKNDWRFGIRISPGVSSNLTAKNLSLNDVVLSGEIVFLKDKRDDKNIAKPYMLLLGVSYSGNRGFPFPLPFVSYFRKFHPKWSYAIGVPKTNLQYYFSETNQLKLYAQLDGFTTNIQQGFLTDSSDIAETLNMSLIITGLQYEYYFTDHLQLYLRAAYIIDQSVKVRDGKKNNLISIDSDNALYLRTGIRFKI